MNVKLVYNKFFAYSESKSKYFLTEFGDQVNIIHGKNTSGKSTFFLSILYAFGINDGNHYLKDILDEKVIFRLDCSLTKHDQKEFITLIRDDDTLFIKRGKCPLKRFNGISSNNSGEHVKLKHYLNELFDFSLQLESKNEYKSAPVETMFLPYYVSQTVGWVYLRKSFSGLDYYKNFKEDYLDYYLGLDPSIDRVKRHELKVKLNNKINEISIISKIETKSEEILLTKLIDEQFIGTSNKYIKEFATNHAVLVENENEYVLRCNELSYWEERRTVLRKVSGSHKNQMPDSGNCPACTQTLPIGMSEIYSYLQEQNDNDNEANIIKAKIKDIQSTINSLQKTISDERINIEKEYSVLNKYTNSGISYDSWLNNKANAQLIENLNQKIGELTIEKQKIEEDLSKYKTDEEIEANRRKYSNEFSQILSIYLKELGVKKLEEERYTKLYQISAFPSQGVELHKTIMAYHFAFNQIISATDNIHRLPLMLDAVFKEDIDDDNKELILKFINKNKPKDTQTIFSIAQGKNQTENVMNYNSNLFANEAKLILIGDGKTERSFLIAYDGNHSDLINETMDILNDSNN